MKRILLSLLVALAVPAFGQTTGKFPRIDKIQSSTAATQNTIINGAFDLWQRGIGAATPNTGRLYLADRFYAQQTAAFGAQILQSTDIPTYAQAGYPFTYSFKVVNGTGASAGSADYLIMGYRVEGLDYAPLHGQPAQLSFWCKSSITGNYAWGLRNNGLTRSYVAPFTITAANTWERKVINLTLDNQGTWLFDTNVGLLMTLFLAHGSQYETNSVNQWLSGNYGAYGNAASWGGTTGSTFLITGVTLYPGSYTAGQTFPFKRAGKLYGDEIRLAQRYFEKSFDIDQTPAANTGDHRLGTVYATSSTTSASPVISFKVGKRASPTITFFNAIASTVNTVSYYNGGVWQSSAAITPGVFGNTTDFTFSPAATFSAGSSYQISGHWTADAEL